MSTTVDQRVVEMRFDNKHFEQNVSTTMSTLEKLKQKLNLSGATKGLQDIDAASKKVDMSGLGTAIDTVQTKFSALQVIGVTALANITNSAVNAGKRIVSALTIDPIKTGFQEYETQINAVQTILANTSSKGTTIDQVNEALEELNKYADQTIYNFTEMTRNIGTFTAAGVGLDTSVSAIKGIANLAAVSGSTSQQASTAMYQLSQALASGTVKLMDWNSVVNAGMGGEVFQNALKETARVHGIAIDDMIKSQGSFRETLKEGWLTSEILTETLEQFTMAAAEGSKEWDEYKKSLMNKGYTEAQANEILKMANTATDAATKVKTFTQLWDVLKESAQSGWSQTWKLIVGDFNEAKSLLTPLAETLTGFINKMSDTRNHLVEGALDFATPWSKIKEKLEGAGLGNIQKLADTVENAADKLTKFQEIVDKVWKGDFATANSGRFELLKEAGYDPRVIQDLVNKGADYRLTIEDVEASHKKFGITMSETTASTSDLTAILGDLTDEQLEAAGLTSEEIKLYRDLAAEADRTGVSISDLIDEMSKTDGRTMLIESFKNAGQGLIKIFGALKDAWVEIFPPTSVVKLYNIIKAIQSFSNHLNISDTTADKLKRTFKGVFAVIDIFRQVVVGALGALKPLFHGVESLGGGILDVTMCWGDWLVNLDETIKKSGVISTVFQGVSNFLKTIVDSLVNFGGYLKDKFASPGLELFHALLERVSARMSGLGEAAGEMRSNVVSGIDGMSSALANCGFVKLLTTLWDAIRAIGSGLASVFGDLTSGFIDKVSSANFDGIFDFINSLSLAGIGVFIAKFVKGFSDITDTISDFKKDFQEHVIGILDSVKGCFEAYQTQLKAGSLMKIAGAIAILAAAIVVISLIDSEKLSASLGAVTVLFADLMGSMAIFGRVTGDLKGVTKACIAMIAISASVLILASALKKVGELEFDHMVSGLVGVFALMAMVVAVIEILGRSEKTVVKGAGQMVIFAVAIKVLASACEDLSTLNWEQLAKGLVGVGVLLAEVSLFLNTAKFSGKSITTATGIVILAASMKILASACADFGKMKWGDIGKGLASIGGLLLMVALFTNLTGNAKHVISTGIALIAIGAAMKIFASAVEDMAKMSWGEIARGLTTLAGALLAVTLAVNFMPKNMVGIGVGLIAVSAAMLILVKVLDQMGDMEWGEIAKGLVAFGGSLLILAVGLKLMSGSLTGSLALVVAAGALAVMTPVLLALGNMQWSSIAKGLVAIAGAFAVIGIAGAVLGPIVPTILGLAGAFALIGVGAIAIGGGLALVALGVGALATALSTGAVAIVAGLTVIVTGVASLIPMIIAKLGEALVAFCMVIAEGAPAIGNAIKALILTVIDVLTTCIPEITTSFLKILTAVLGALVEYTPQVVGLLYDFLIGIINAAADKIPGLIQAAVNLLMAFFSGVIDALSGINVETLIKGIAGIGVMSGIMLALSAVAALVPGAMIGVLGMGAVIAELALVLGAIGILAQLPGLEWLIGEGGKLLEGIGVAIGSFIGGIVGGVMGGITGQLPGIGNDLSMFMLNAMPFITGAKTIDSGVMDGVSTLAKVILTLTAANILDGLSSWLTGGSSLTRFGEQLPQLGSDISKFAENLGGFNEGRVSCITCAANAIKSLAEAASILPNDGGWAGKMFGENSIAAFGEQLPGLGTNLSAFAANLGTFGDDKVTAVTSAANAIAKIANVANDLPNDGGWAGKIFGENSIAAFAKNLPELGTNINKFASNLGTFNDDKVTTISCAANAIVKVAEAAKGLPNDGGWAGKIFGENSLATFGSKLGDFGSNLSAFAENLGTFDNAKVTTINASVKAVKALSGLADADLSGAKKNLGGFGDKVVEFAKDIKSFCSNMPGAETISTAVSNIKKILEIIEDVSAADPEAAGKFTNSLKDLGKAGIDAFVKTVASNTAKTDVANAAKTLLASFTNKINNSVSVVKTSLSNLVIKAADGLKSKTAYDKVYNAGSYLVDGFVAGIDDNDYKAAAQARAMAKAAAKAAEEELDINSPSKVFKRIGSSIPEGFVMGIDKFGSMVSASAAHMGDVAIAGVNDSISKISDIVTEDIDASPVIRPVLDLTGVESKAGILSKLFDTPASMGVLANIGAISSMMNSNQNGSNDDVISAINRLRESLDAVRGDTYNINGITYDDGSNIKEAIEAIIKWATIERRV